MKPGALLLAGCVFLGTALSVQGQAVQFAGFEWSIRSGEGGPGPNQWDEQNVWLDQSGALHLRIAHRDNKWSCAEVTMRKRLGFGRYEFQISGPIDRLDDNVVLGLFNYPTRDVGSDATHEIDIEFARWGAARNPIGNYTVWPAEIGLKQQTKSFPFTLDTDQTTHRFIWSPARILFQSLRGHRPGDNGEFGRWIFSPEDASRRISQKAMPVHINLWLFRGLAPKDGKEVEMVVRSFTFTAQ